MHGPSSQVRGTQEYLDTRAPQCGRATCHVHARARAHCSLVERSSAHATAAPPKDFQPYEERLDLLSSVGFASKLNFLACSDPSPTDSCITFFSPRFFRRESRRQTAAERRLTLTGLDALAAQNTIKSHYSGHLQQTRGPQHMPRYLCTRMVQDRWET